MSVKKDLLSSQLDWSKEKTVDRSFCGYCDNTPINGSCDGDCFLRKDYSPAERRRIQLIHVNDELNRIKETRKSLAQRKVLLEKELFKLKNVNPLP